VLDDICWLMKRGGAKEPWFDFSLDRGRLAVVAYGAVGGQPYELVYLALVIGVGLRDQRMQQSGMRVGGGVLRGIGSSTSPLRV
jgi:hypothetical protein